MKMPQFYTEFYPEDYAGYELGSAQPINRKYLQEQYGFDYALAQWIESSVNAITHQASMASSDKKFFQYDPIMLMESSCDVIRRNCLAPLNNTNWMLVSEDEDNGLQQVFELMYIDHTPWKHTGIHLMVCHITEKYYVFYLPKVVANIMYNSGLDR